MSLMHLLAVGKAIQHEPSVPSPYHMTKERVLPKFAPIGRSVSLAPPKTAMASPAGRYAPINPFRHQPAAQGQAQPAAAMTAAPAPEPELALFTGRKPARSGAENRRRNGSRDEARLAAVTVLRNDLAGSDFVVVPATGGRGGILGKLAGLWHRLAAVFTFGFGWLKG